MANTIQQGNDMPVNTPTIPADFFLSANLAAVIAVDQQADTLTLRPMKSAGPNAGDVHFVVDPSAPALTFSTPDGKQAIMDLLTWQARRP
jgi:hypothetical protein